jgi:DnaD/phage-associated family protein
MTDKLFKLLENPAFLDASRDELRVLVALIANKNLSADEISLICGISHARASSAISFWSDIGVLSENGEPTITEEFEERLRRGEIIEESSKKVAGDIRDMGLKNVIDECARLMNKAALSSNEIKKIAALRTQYALSDEYILVLAAHLSDKNKLTATRLVDKALELVGKEIDTAEALETHIKICESENGIIRELKSVLSMNGRNLSPREKELLTKWSKDYGYFTEIVSYAYNICVDNIHVVRLSYIDRVLTTWYESGCRTISECRAKSEELKFDFSKKRAKPGSAKKAPEKSRYGDFDVKDAFKRALERSYGKDDKK